MDLASAQRLPAHVVFPKAGLERDVRVRLARSHQRKHGGLICTDRAAVHGADLDEEVKVQSSPVLAGEMVLEVAWFAWTVV